MSDRGGKLVFHSRPRADIIVILREPIQTGSTPIMFPLRRQSSSLGRSLLVGRSYSNAPTAPGVTGAAHTPKPGSPIASANPSEADPQNVYQAPNHPSTWSTSQNPKKHAFSGPRFEQVNFSLQPQPISAMAMVAEDPVRLVPGRKATCDGGKSKSYVLLPSKASG